MSKNSRAIKKSIPSIEAIFTVLLGLTIAAAIVSIVVIIAQSVILANQEHEIEAYNEWTGVAVVVLFMAIMYELVFFIWQFALWRRFRKERKHKWVQLTLILILAIVPSLNYGLDYILRQFFEIEEPFTEAVNRLYLYILIYPLTGGV